MATINLDLTGEVCPVPLLKAKKACSNLKQGEVVQIETDYNRAVCNILDWSDANGLKYDVQETIAGWKVRIWHDRGNERR